MYPIGAVTEGSKGEQLAEIGELRPGRLRGASPTTAGRWRPRMLMRRALEYAGMFGMPVIDHCEDPTLKGEGVAHEGYVASVLGLRGIPAAAEDVMVERDIVARRADRRPRPHRAPEHARGRCGPSARRRPAACA